MKIIKGHEISVLIQGVNTKSDTINCESCNLHHIHINDWENHENSRRHQRNYMGKDDKVMERQNSYNITCYQCNKEFTDETFYKRHLGTKTHRRNRKRLGLNNKAVELQSAAVPFSVVRKSVTIRGRKLAIPSAIHDDVPIVIRKKYKIRGLKTDDLYFRSYIYSLTSFLSLRLALNQHIQDFTISVNNKDWGAFGDIVINIVYENKEKTTIYAIQCKRVTQSARQITGLEEAKVHLEKQYDNLSKLKKTWKDYDTKFAIFTTYNTSSSFCKSVKINADVLNTWKTGADIFNDATIDLKPLTKKNDIINVTSDPENVYSFHLRGNVECELPNLLFYTSQRVFPSMINQLLKLKFDNYPDIATDYTKYVENWGEGKLGGNYYLRKKDVILKLGEILLTPYVISPQKIQSEHNNFDTWNSVLEKVDLTIVQMEPFIISKLCQPLNKVIEETIDTKIDTITRTVNLRNESRSILDNLKDPIKPYFFEVVQNHLREDIPLSLIYNIFWRAGIIPLLLSSENREESKGFIVDVIAFMKQMGVKKKFLLKTADLNLIHFKEHLKIFSCLEDVKEFVYLDDIKIRVSDSFSLSLSTIHSTDPFFLRGVTPNMFFNLSLDKYSLNPSHGRKFKKRDDLKIILSDEVKETLEKNLYARSDLLRMNSSSYMDEKLRGIDPCLF